MICVVVDNENEQLSAGERQEGAVWRDRGFVYDDDGGYDDASSFPFFSVYLGY